MKESTVYMPEYLLNFSCIGSNCEDTCCQDWTVTVDKKTYNQYFGTDNKDLKEKFQTNIKRFQTGDKYAVIKMQEDMECPFLTDDLLCEIQQKLGADYLSNTCANYPRTFTSINNYEELEMGMTSSCPEVARIALLSKDKMKFTQAEQKFPTARHASTHIKLSPSQQQYYTKVRSFAIEVLQNREYSFRSRLFLLGFFYQKLLEDISKYESAIEHCRKLNASPFMREQIHQLPGLPDLHFQLIEIYMKIIVSRTIDFKHYNEVIVKTFRGLMPDLESGGTVTVEYKAYFDMLHRFYGDSRQWEHVIENYFVNDLFNNLTTSLLNPEKHLWDSYILQCLSYVLLQIHFAGIYASEGALSNEMIVKIFYNFSRRIFSHNADFVKASTHFLHELGTTSLAHLTGILRA